MKVVFLVGPTASGKTGIALKLAEKFGGAILNADSVQVYGGLSIGSAAPTADEKSRAPHFFFQEIAPPERITAGDYARRARAILAELASRFPIVFVVGGTGFYLMALEKGMLPVEKSDPALQDEFARALEEEGGPERLHSELAARDPEAGKRISVQDHYRIARALEVIRRTGKPLTEIEREHREKADPFPYPLLKLGIRIDRDVLRGRIETRTKAMLSQGIVGEVQGLIEAGFGDWEPLQSVGYKETLEDLRSGGVKPDLEARIVQSTMKLAKKQRTWFQRDAEILWGEPEGFDFFEGRVREFLGI